MKLNFLQHIHRKALNLFIETFVILTLSHLLPRYEVSSCNLFTAITYTDLPWPPWSSSWELMRCCPLRYNLQQVLPKTELSALTLFCFVFSWEWPHWFPRGPLQVWKWKWLNRVWLFTTPQTVACQASLSITTSRSLLKLMSIQPSHTLSSPSPPAPNPSQHQIVFQWVNSSHEVAKVLEFQLQHHSFQWTPRTDLL